jgi:hypothetical protein
VAEKKSSNNAVHLNRSQNLRVFDTFAQKVRSLRQETLHAPLGALIEKLGELRGDGDGLNERELGVLARDDRTREKQRASKEG